MRALALAFALLFAAEASAQQAYLIEISPDNFVGIVVTSSGKVKFIEAKTIKTDPTVPPPSVNKPTRAVYVYEKDSGAVPPQVAGALNVLNRQALEAGSGFVADEFEDDTVDGTGQVPDQFKVALETARKPENGLPCLVVLAGDKVIRTVKSPKTARDIEEAVKP
jgi:hypothetical protein